MKNLIVLFLLSLTTCIQAQETKGTAVYRYIIAQPDGNIFSDKIQLKVDDGTEIRKVRDEEGKTITFKSAAAGLMYLTLQGWELMSNYTNVSGSSSNGTGSTSTNNYWILRKASTKEEVQNIVNKSIKKKKED